MRIGIDARLLEETGVGRYIRNLIYELSLLDTEHEYIVFLTAKSYGSFTLPNKRWQKRLIDVHWHTIKEQLVLPMVFMWEQLDLLHVPYFTIPLLYPRKMVVTIHDITVYHDATGRASLLPKFLYFIKKLGYSLVLSLGLARAAHIFAVSHTTKKELVQFFHVSPKKITVTYEGVTPYVPKEIPEVAPQLMRDKFFLYVGNAYPHKNADMLLNAFSMVPGNVEMVFVGPLDVFYQRLMARAAKEERCVFIHHASDSQLAWFYHHAQALVFPSKREGFGLPILEAATYGCPVIASDIPIFHELYGEYPTYVHPQDSQGWTKAMMKHLEKKSSKLWNTPSEFSWKRMAERTRAVYMSI